jgi:hypothetical protein
MFMGLRGIYMDKVIMNANLDDVLEYHHSS